GHELLHLAKKRPLFALQCPRAARFKYKPIIPFWRAGPDIASGSAASYSHIGICVYEPESGQQFSTPALSLPGAVGRQRSPPDQVGLGGTAWANAERASRVMTTMTAAVATRPSPKKMSRPVRPSPASAPRSASSLARVPR